SGELVEQPTAEVLLEALPGSGRLLEAGEDRGEGEPGRLLRHGAFHPAESQPQPGGIQAVDRANPLVACRTVLARGLETVSQAAVAPGGEGVVVAQESAADRHRLL